MITNHFESEENLVAALRRSESKAYDHLHHECRPMILNFVRLNNGSPEDGLDLLQSAMIVLLRSLQKPDFKFTCKVKVYIYSICRKQWLNQLRKKKKHNLFDIGDYVEIPDLPEEEDNWLNSEQLNKAIDMLDDTCRKLLISFYFNEQGLEEIGRNLNIASYEAVKVRRFRCMQNLKKIAKTLLTNDERG
jgi:RNA polymerase sigma factor (sigma-70 family)